MKFKCEVCGFEYEMDAEHFDFNDKTIGAEIINASKLFGLTPQNLTAIKKGKIINVLAPDSVMVKIIFPLERPVEYIVNVTEEMPQLTV